MADWLKHGVRKLRDDLEQHRIKKYQSRLTNQQFSIISSNCIGGVMYHLVGHRFDSPTINLWVNSDDYLRLITNLDYYRHCDILTDTGETDDGHPIGRLGEGDQSITLHFTHYPDFRTAKAAWMRRMKRLDMQHLYFVTTDRDGMTEEQMIAFDHLPFKHKVLFVGRPHPEIACAFLIPHCEENGHLGDCTQHQLRVGKRKFEAFDFVSFLNSKI